MQIKLYNNFSKRVNSTKIPTSTPVTLECTLKADTSIESPTFLLKNYDNKYNYISWGNHYYFVNDVIYGINGYYEVNCITDVLATYRELILNSTQFVERSSSNFDLYLNDSSLSTKQLIKKEESKNIVAGFNDVGCYIIRVISHASHLSNTGIEMYALSPSQLGNLLSYLYDGDNFVDVLKEYYITAVFNPIDYIVSIKWFPFTPDKLNGVTIDNIWIGWYQTSIGGRLLQSYGGTIELDIKPFTPYFNDFRDNNPQFTQYSLYVPSYGLVTIPSDKINYDDGIYVLCSVDFSTGQFSTFIYTGNDKTPQNSTLLTSVVGMIGYDVQIGQTVANIGEILNEAEKIGDMMSTYNGNPASILGNAIETTRIMFSPNTRTLGSTGAVQGFKNHPWFTLNRTIYDCAEFPVDVIGRPLMKNVSLSTLKGFTKCGNASIDIPGLGSEKEEVNNMLNNGFYIE